MPKRSLRYVTDRTAGITRHRRRRRDGGSVFSYRHPDGSPVRDAATLQRIRSLAIPPAYEQVWICPHPRGHLQATGRDARGRKQYRYHPEWREDQEAGKHARMHAFGKALPKLRRKLHELLRQPGLSRDKVLALVVTLMDRTCARVGNSEYARSNGSYGLTTLQDRHLRRHRGGTMLRFNGKSGLLHEVSIEDERLATLVRKCQALPGQHLFQYIDADGHRRSVDSTQVNAFLREQMGEDFTAKDFRTWHATRRAYELLCAAPRPQPCSDRACRQALKQVVCKVAAQLRNTPAVCRKSYINPLVLTAWQAGDGPFAPGRRARGTAPLLKLLRHSAVASR